MTTVITKEQALIITGFTGTMAVKNFSDFHKDVEKRLGRPVFTHEFGSESVMAQIKEAYRADFITMTDI